MIGWPALRASYLTALDLCQHFLILSGKDVCRVRMSSCPNCWGFVSYLLVVPSFLWPVRSLLVFLLEGGTSVCFWFWFCLASLPVAIDGQSLSARISLVCLCRCVCVCVCEVWKVSIFDVDCHVCNVCSSASEFQLPPGPDVEDCMAGDVLVCVIQVSSTGNHWELLKSLGRNVNNTVRTILR